MSHEFYENPLIRRYASPEMSRLWGDQKKFRTWRQLWVWLAEAEAELGLSIPPAKSTNSAAISITSISPLLKSTNVASATTSWPRSHLRRPVPPSPRHYSPRRHQLLRDRQRRLNGNARRLKLLAARLATVIDRLAKFAHQNRNLPCLGFTHLQPAQPTTVGKRACLWAADLALDLREIEHRLAELKARGVKGATGTQASFLELFGGDQPQSHVKVQQLEQLVAQKIGFSAVYPVTGQTYSRKIDSQVLAALSGIAQSAHKAATDLRILASRKELEEPFEADQIGSSAMAYKRNPMPQRTNLRPVADVMSLESSAAATASTQWLERTLDDGANRRLVIPQAFLAVDAILILYQNIAAGLVVYPNVIAKHLAEELPFMATENILMAAVAAGGDRQDLHERIRRHSQAAAKMVKEQGGANDLIDRLKADTDFAKVDVAAALDPLKFVAAPRSKSMSSLPKRSSPFASAIAIS